MPICSTPRRSAGPADPGSTDANPIPVKRISLHRAAAPASPSGDAGPGFATQCTAAAVRRPWRVLGLCLMLALAALITASQLLGVDSETVAMLDEDLAFRQTYTRFQEQFPQLDATLIAVIEAPTPEQATLAARRLRGALQRHPEVIDAVSWPAGSEFFIRHGLLFLPLEELQRLGQRLTEVQPLLGRLAQATHAATLFELLSELERREATATSPLDREQLYRQLGDVIDAAMEGEPGLLSWRRLLDAQAPAAATPVREILLINPVLDHSRVLAGETVMRTLDRLRTELAFERDGARLELTGKVALGYEEMRSVITGARLTGGLALILVSALMLIGLRSLRLSLIALANLVLGLALTLGFTALAIGRVNLISVTFVVLYIGLGVNYAVHYLLRYRELASGGDGGAPAVIATGGFLARPLLLSALTTALGFFAFVPTAFAGVAQLGLIAGVAMLITLMLSYTALPAMLALFAPPLRSRRPQPHSGWRGALDWPLRYRVAVILLGGLLLVAALPTLDGLRFDSDPLNLRDPDSESVTTLRRLLEAGEGGYRNIQVLVEPDDPVAPLRERLQALPAVARAVSLESFVPADQPAKLALLEQLSWGMGPGIITADWQPQPLTARALRAAAGELAGAFEGVPGGAAAELRMRLARLQARLQQPGGDALAQAVNRALVAGLAPALGPVSAALSLQTPVTRADLPPWLRHQWVGRDGTRMIQLFPDVNVEDAAAQRAFTQQVLEIVPQAATGGPVIQQAASTAITTAFRQALGWAVAGIALVLLISLRSLSAAAKVLAPLALGGVLTAAAMVGLGIPFNFANVIALPLLLGVAVDNGIHLVLRHRAGELFAGNVLYSASARAVVFGALITAGGFGNLAFSPHTGTAGLGLILALGLALMVIATLVFLPALLGRR
mgnify:CR=1 FL=1